MKFTAFLIPLLCLPGVAWGQPRAASKDVRSAAARHFPYGTAEQSAAVNAFVIFVQFPDDTYDNDLTTDPVTEWPAAWSSLEEGRRLPAWAGTGGEALLAPPETPPAAYAEGSVSQFYHLMSGGRLRFTGDVYPRVYIPQHGPQWYVDHRESPTNPQSTGAVHLSREILNAGEIQDYFATHYPGDAIQVFDRYTNGAGANLTPDGLFDMIILLFRLSDLPRMVQNCKAGQRCRGFSSITNFGTLRNNVSGSDTFDAVGDPVRIGGLRVVDNSRSGSGVIGEALNKKAAVRIIAHEIGHRHFYLQHTCYDRGADSRNADCIGIMSGGPYLTFSAPDRMKLGWTNVIPLDLSSLSGIRRVKLRALTPGVNEVLRIQRGPLPGCGDVIVEARTWANYWDRPPDGRNNDGTDKGDFWLPQEGLYLYKAANGERACGGSAFFFSSLESNGQVRDPDKGFRNYSVYDAGFTPGMAYTPFTPFAFASHRNAAIDEHLALTDIRINGNDISFNVWPHYTRDDADAIRRLADTPSLDEPPRSDATLVTPFVFAPGFNEAGNAASVTEPGAVVAYTLMQTSRVRLAIYDQYGREVARPVDALQAGGAHRVLWRAIRVPDGVYKYRLDINGDTHREGLLAIGF